MKRIRPPKFRLGSPIHGNQDPIRSGPVGKLLLALLLFLLVFLFLLLVSHSSTFLSKQARRDFFSRELQGVGENVSPTIQQSEWPSLDESALAAKLAPRFTQQRAPSPVAERAFVLFACHLEQSELVLRYAQVDSLRQLLRLFPLLFPFCHCRT